MASWQAHTTSFLLRHTFKRQLASASGIEQVRKLMGGVRAQTPGHVAFESWGPAEYQGERVRDHRTPPRHTLMYIHGGGFIACSPRTHRPITVALACQGFDVLVPDYRLAPEHPYPQGLQDIWFAYGDAVKHAGGAKQLVLCGDSAGAGLLVSLLLRLRDAQLPMPAAAALFSPFVDLTLSSASVQANAQRCAMFTPETLTRAVQLYLPGNTHRTQEASPLYQDLKGLPPLLIHAAQDETLRDDATTLASRAQSAGVEVDLRIWPGVPHAWPLFRHFIPEGRTSLDMAAEFLHRHARSTP